MAIRRRKLSDTNELPEIDSPRENIVDAPETVSQLTSRIKGLLEDKFQDLYVVGQISGWHVSATSGHTYFSLKDESSVISCVIWKSSGVAIDRSDIKDGTQVEIRGKISLYVPKGNYQIIVQYLQKMGLGRLWQLFEKLKAKLKEEGLFSDERKKAIPAYPAKIGIVTAISGAAIRDIISILRRRAPQMSLFVYNCKVQGEGAAEEIAHGIAQLNRIDDIDVMIVGRGGGSMEDLWAFNEEIVARAVVASKIPVISAVGHEIDFTIADFVADLRAATPSAAAEIVSQNSVGVLLRLSNIEKQMKNHMSSHMRIWHGNMQIAERLYLTLPYRMEQAEAKWERLQRRLDTQNPQRRIEMMRQQLDDHHESMRNYLHLTTIKYRHQIEMFETKLNALSPFAVLGRGYSIVYDDKKKKVITSANQATEVMSLRIQFEKDSVRAVVESEENKMIEKRERRSKNHKPESMTDDLFGDLND